MANAVAAWSPVIITGSIPALYIPPLPLSHRNAGILHTDQAAKIIRSLFPGPPGKLWRIFIGHRQHLQRFSASLLLSERIRAFMARSAEQWSFP